MGFLMDRISVVSTCVVELAIRRLPEFEGDLDREIVILLDGVGGFQFVPLLARKVIREQGLPIGSTWFRWQVPVPGMILFDLMLHRRNRLMAAKLARKMLQLHRSHVNARLHLIAFSGGTGIAAFALEQLRGRVPIETLILACPALSPTYNLGPTMRGVQRAYALISHRDRWMIGLGTRLFGTMDRQFTRSAGMVGFMRPAGLSAIDKEGFDRVSEIHWGPDLKKEGHAGGHTGWAHVPFLRRHLGPMLAGCPLLPTRPVR